MKNIKWAGQWENSCPQGSWSISFTAGPPWIDGGGVPVSPLNGVGWGGEGPKAGAKKMGKQPQAIEGYFPGLPLQQYLYQVGCQKYGFSLILWRGGVRLVNSDRYRRWTRIRLVWGIFSTLAVVPIGGQGVSNFVRFQGIWPHPLLTFQGLLHSCTAQPSKTSSKSRFRFLARPPLPTSPA